MLCEERERKKNERTVESKDNACGKVMMGFSVLCHLLEEVVMGNWDLRYRTRLQTSDKQTIKKLT